MEITYQSAWERDEPTHGGYCDANKVRDGVLLGANHLKCQYGCSETISSLQYICTEFSISDDWSFGSRVMSYDFSAASDSFVTIGFASNDWLGFSHWNVSTTFQLTPRSDNGQINSSPRAITIPILRLQSGCHYTIPITVSDPDGDIVRCRWAVGDECKSVCNAIPGAVLSSATCTITYHANNGTGYKAVAVMLEDFVSGSSLPLSSVALQFLVLVVSSSQPCSHKPKFILPTPSSGSCVPIPPGGTYTTQLRAYSGYSGASISKIQIASSIGVKRGSLTRITSTRNYYVNIQWTPQSSQQKLIHHFCFVAINSDGISSEQTCIYIHTGGLIPQPIPWVNKLLVHLTDAKFPITFDIEIQHSPSSAFITFVEQSSDLEVYRINSSSSELSFRKPRQLTIKPNHVFTDATIYYIKIEKEIVNSKYGCTGNSAKLDKTSWIFEITGK